MNLNTKTTVYLTICWTPHSIRRLAQLPSLAPSMPGFVLGTGRVGALSASTLPPEGVLPDSSSPAEVLPVLLSPTPRPEGRSNEGRPQSSPSRSPQPNHAAFTTTSLTAGCGSGLAEIDTLGVTQFLPSKQTDPCLTRESSLTGAIGRTNGYHSFGAQPPQGTKTVGAGPNVRPQPVCRDSGNRRSRTRVRSPHPLKEARKRRAIFYDYNKKWKKTSMLGRARASADEADRAVGTSVIWMLRVGRLYLAREQPPLHTLTPVSTRLGLNRSGQGNFDLPLGLLPRNSVLVIHPSAFHVWLFPTKCGTPPAHPIEHQQKTMCCGVNSFLTPSF